MKWVNSFTQDATGALWGGWTPDQKVFRWQAGRLTTFSQKEGIGPEGEATVYSDKAGRVWFTTVHGCGVFLQDHFQQVDPRGGIWPRVGTARAGGMWATRNGMLLRYQADGSQVMLDRIGVITVHVIYEDSHGTIWIGTNDQGLFRFRQDKHGQVDLARIPISNTSVSAIMEDAEGNLWVGTNGGGINRLRPARFSLRQKAQGLNTDYTVSLCQDSEDRLWLVGRDGVPIRAQDGGNRSFAPPTGWSGPPIMAMSPAQNLTFNGSTGSEIHTFSNTSTPTFFSNSFYNGTLYWGAMHVVAGSGLNVATGYNNLVLQSGLTWDSGSSGTITLTQPASDGNIVFAQGNGVLASTMDLNLGSGSQGSLLVINGGTTQTVGALTGTANDYITAYSGTNGVFRNSTTPSGTNTVATSSAPAVLRIGNTSNSATFAGIIGAQSGSKLAGTDTLTAAGYLSLVKLGSGTETLTGVNVYSGGTTVSAGTLAVTGSGKLGSGNVTVASGASLQLGSGSETGVNYVDDLASIILTGSSSSLALNFSSSASETVYSLTINGVNISAGTYTASAINGLTGTSQVSGTGNLVVVAAVPEPGTGVLMLGGLGARLGFQRSRRLRA